MIGNNCVLQNRKWGDKSVTRADHRGLNTRTAVTTYLCGLLLQLHFHMDPAVKIHPRRQWWLKQLGSCYPRGRCGLSSLLPDLAWSSSAVLSIWRVHQWMEASLLLLSLPLLHLWQLLKYIKLIMFLKHHMLFHKYVQLLCIN